MAEERDNAASGTRVVSFQDMDKSSQSVDPLISTMNSSQIDLPHQSEQRFSHVAQDDPPSRTVSRLTETAKRLVDFAESLLDPANEGDPFYQTAVSIYSYFGHRFSVVSILSAIHAHGGDVRATVFHLAGAADVAEDLEFDARTVSGDRDAYFRF
jgi:hypothetical protein